MREGTEDEGKTKNCKRKRNITRKKGKHEITIEAKTQVRLGGEVLGEAERTEDRNEKETKKQKQNDGQ